MAISVRVTTVGNSLGIILPKEVLTKLRVDKGDVLQVIETADGIRLTPYDAELAAQLDAAEAVMRRRRSVLRKLKD